MKVVLYSTGCSKCAVLEKKLTNAKVDFEVSDNVKIPMKQGFLSAPILEVDGKMMEFSAAVNWVNSLE